MPLSDILCPKSTYPAHPFRRETRLIERIVGLVGGKELAVQNATLREDVASWAKECDRIVERHTKTRTNMHLLEAQRELRELSPIVISQNNEVAL